MSLAFVFPGQGSQSIGMMSALARVAPVIEATFGEASEVLGYDLWRRCQEGPAEALNSTECTQPAMLTAGIATYRLWRGRGGAQPALMAGHSLGEFTALVAAGTLDFRTAVDLVKYRGELMQTAVPPGQGAMAAILGLEDIEIEEACREAAQGEVVEAVNFNSPAQVVIAGEAAAVGRAIELAKSSGAKRAITLPVSVPSHSSLMRNAGERLRERLSTLSVLSPAIRYVSAVDAAAHDSPDDIREVLVRQLSSPVLWTQTLRAISAAHVAQVIECGPGKVLTGLNRRIEPREGLSFLALEDPASVDAALRATKGA
jgi:[acyl-carrier-protein] S-malonyltransferase